MTGVGQAVGPLSLTDLDGKPQALPSGRRVLVNLWASWCGPCRDEMPLLDAFAREQGGTGVVVVGIAEDDAAPIREFLRTSSISYPTLLDDANGHSATRLGNPLGILPFSVLLDADGKLLRSRLGAFPDQQSLQRWVASGN
ncbi:MAG: TlpA family protein disulfide reductase [Proteobacteria bacterium]|nr:TlpA family protein disulfide reductase [Pseudomonadota bacterium]